MIPQVQKNIFVYKFLNGLSQVGFNKYTICFVSFKSREEKGYFGTYVNGDNPELKEKLEGKIVVKSWKELSAKFPECILGDYSLKPDSFSGIVMIDNSQAPGNPGKYIPKIMTAFKNRSTLLLNQFHSTHGRILWENSYESITIDNADSFNSALRQLRN